MKLSGIVFSLMAVSATAFAPSPSKTVTVNLRPNSKSNPWARPTQSLSFPSETKTQTSTQLYSSMVDESGLLNFFLMKLIETGIPTTFTIITIIFAAKAFKGKGGDETTQVSPAVSELYDDLYGNNGRKSSPPFLNGFGGNKNKGPTLPRNSGIPAKQYITLKNLNEKYDSYEYNMIQATQSKATAAATLRTKNFDRALQLSTFGTELQPHEKSKLVMAEENLLKTGSKVMETIIAAETQLTDIAIQEEMAKLGLDVNALDPVPVNGTGAQANATNFMANIMGGKQADVTKAKTSLENELVKSQKALLHLETTFIQNVTQVLGPEKVNAFRAATLGDISTRGVGQLLRQLGDRPLSTMLSNGDDRKKSLFVMKFPGDISASQVQDLREEVTAVVRTAKRGDEALLVLESGGGTVTGYGLAAGQLKRFKENGIKLTVCVEQVAASGGYMMCCVADRIVASPMAVLGSIGVISDIPNVYERLLKEGIEFQTVTAGKYKRTLTPTKKATKEDFAKTKDDVENILVLFKQFVHQNRPSLDIDKVATGETWFGTDALELGLCDEIKTVDTCLTEFVDSGYNVFEIKYAEPPVNQLTQLLGPKSETAGASNGMVGQAVRWMVSTIKTEIQAELSESTRTPVDRRYMMQDDTADRTRFD